MKKKILIPIILTALILTACAIVWCNYDRDEGEIQVKAYEDYEFAKGDGSYTYDTENEIAVVKDLEEKDLFELKLIDNTDHCLKDCYAIIQITPLNNFTRLSSKEYGFSFIDETINTKQINYEIEEYIGGKYEEKCSFNITKGGESCESPLLDKYWKDTSFDSLNYIKGQPILLKLTGEKDYSESVDWIPKIHGFEFPEMAWWNGSDGFDVKLAGCNSQGGMTSNGTDFWISDAEDDFVYHFSADGTNMSDGFDIGAGGVGTVRDITMNSSNFFMVDSVDSDLYIYNRDGTYLAQFDTDNNIWATSPFGIATNGSDFWIEDNADNYVYHLNRNYGNLSDGFSTEDFVTAIGFVQLEIDMKGDIWISASGKGMVFHTNVSGTNITSNVLDTGVFGALTPWGIAINSRGIWVVDTTDDYVYHFTTTTPTVDIPSITPAQPTESDTLNCSTIAYDNDLDLMNVNLTWYGNATLYESVLFTSVANGSMVSRQLLPAGVQNAGEIWNCTAFSSDGLQNSLPQSLTREIGDAVTVTPYIPFDNAEQTNHTALFEYNTTSALGNIISNCSLWTDDDQDGGFNLNQTNTGVHTPNNAFLVSFGNIGRFDWKIGCYSNMSVNGNSTARTLLINNNPTIPNILSPANETVYSGSVNLNCSNSTDIDGDTIYIEFYGDTNPNPVTLLQNSTFTNYTWSAGIGTHYWKCRASDLYGFSANTATRMITDISGSIELTYNCTSGYVEAEYYDFKHENNLTSLNGSVNYNLQLSLGGAGNSTIYGTVSNVDHFSICINTTVASNYTVVYGELEYSSIPYAQRRHYLFKGDRLTTNPVNDTL
jgi:hypothetical protein